MQFKWEKKMHRIASVAAAILIFAAIAGAIWHLSLFLFNTDVLESTGLHSVAAGDSKPVIYLFRQNALTTGYYALCLFVLAIAATVSVIMIIGKKRCSQITLPERRGALQIMRIFAGFALIAIPAIFAVFKLYGFEAGKYQGNANLFAMLLAVPASLYFLFPGIADRFSEFLQTLFGMCFVGFAILSAITTHSYMFEGLTSPVRHFALISFLAMILFIMYEIRFFAAKPLPNMYLACAGLALFFCGTNGLPRLILTLIGEMKVSIQTMYAFLEVTVALYALCRILLFLSEWSYTLQNAALCEGEALPDSVSLSDPEGGVDTVEPDYTEDSEIETPILDAAIDVAMYDLAFDGLEVDENDALDTLTGTSDDLLADEVDPLFAITDFDDEPTAEEGKDSIDPLDQFAIFDAAEADSAPDVPEFTEEQELEENKEGETADKLDVLSTLMFGESEEN